MWPFRKKEQKKEQKKEVKVLPTESDEVFCINCKYYRKVISDWCYIPSNSKNCVTGDKDKYIKDLCEYKNKYCHCKDYDPKGV